MSQIPLFQQTTRPNDTPEWRAVEATIINETESFRTGNQEDWAKCWLHADRTEYVCVMPNSGLITMRGWDKICDHITRVMHDDLVCPQIRYERDNLMINLNGNMAWARFDGTSYFEDGCSLVTYETRILEKINGTWKIAYATVVSKHGNDLGYGVMALNSTGHIVWSSPGVSERLETHPIFMLSHGRLRARRPDWDKNLQSGLADAAAYHGDFELHKFTSINGSTLRFPVFLGETDAGGLALAHILVRDQMTYLQMDGDALIEQRLQLAKTIYRLSDGQLAVARHVVKGDGLKAAATALGISVNTARTHLTRLYEKTGVNAQTALVRLLLSTG